jgi:hypothetical protein
LLDAAFAHLNKSHLASIENFNDTYSVGDKEESFVEQEYQVGIKNDRRYYGLANFMKHTESTMKAQSMSLHPLVKQHHIKVLES